MIKEKTSKNFTSIPEDRKVVWYRETEEKVLIRARSHLGIQVPVGNVSYTFLPNIIKADFTLVDENQSNMDRILTFFIGSDVQLQDYKLKIELSEIASTTNYLHFTVREKTVKEGLSIIQQAVRNFFYKFWWLLMMGAILLGLGIFFLFLFYYRKKKKEREDHIGG